MNADVYSADRPLWRTTVRNRALLADNTSCDVAVVGAGITGLTATVVLARAGLDVRVVEARHVGAGTTGGSTAKVTTVQGTRFSDLRRHHPADVVRQYAEATIAGQGWVREMSSTGRGAVTQDGVSYATTPRGREVLGREAAAMREAGLSVELTDDVGLPVKITGALVAHEQLMVDPGAYLDALVDEALLAGAVLHEDMTVVGMSLGSPPVLRCTSRGADERRLRARHVVMASGIPLLDRGGYFARVEPLRSYCVAVKVRGQRPEGMYLSVDQPTRSVRQAATDALVVGGNGHVVGRATGTRRRLDDLESWARERFDVVATTHRWAAQDYSTTDHLPFVGRLLPTRSDVLVATGFAKWGMTTGTAAALALAGAVLGDAPSWAGSWQPWRRDVVRQAPSLVRFNAAVSWHLLKGWAGAAASGAGDPVEGEGVVRRGARGPVAVSRVDGKVRALSAVCTHLGGVVQWNDGERSWDCPLHGSRFSPDGRRLEGPATCPLAQQQGNDPAAGGISA